jgi:uncharacterized damage-inducible protein DinB
MPNQTQTLNPYAKYLRAGETPLASIKAAPDRFTELISGASQVQLLQQPAPNKWSVRDILCHLADCEIAFAFRLRQALAENRHTIQPFDQDAFARNYGALRADEALSTYTNLRRWDVSFIDTVGPAAMSKVVTHPERGEMTFQTIVETMAGHDLNHFGQIAGLLNK